MPVCQRREEQAGESDTFGAEAQLYHSVVLLPGTPYRRLVSQLLLFVVLVVCMVCPYPALTFIIF